jgi:hypothetical protein
MLSLLEYTLFLIVSQTLTNNKKKRHPEMTFCSYYFTVVIKPVLLSRQKLTQEELKTEPRAQTE